MKSIDGKNIFLIDALGALLSLFLTAGVLPFFSTIIGISEGALFLLAAFPLACALYSWFCFKGPSRRAWMLQGLVLANSLYILISVSLMLFLKGITVWGRLVLSGEVLVLFFLIILEWRVCRNEFYEKNES